MLYPLSYGGLTAGSLPVTVANSCAAQILVLANLTKLLPNWVAAP